MKVQAAVLWERGQPLSVEEVDLDPPGPGEVLVEVKAAGVCHSDLHPALDEWPTRTPLVLGHEGAGVIREVGAGVTRLRAGDPVVLCWTPSCGVCPACAAGRTVLCDRVERTTFRNRLPGGSTRLHARGKDIGHFLGTACFAEYAVVAQEGAVAVPEDVPFDLLAMVGCAVVTGVGAVLTAARATGGASVAIIGAGGVGLNAAQGASIAGCAPIVAIDRRRPPLDLALALGATDVVDATETEPPAAVQRLTRGVGADFVFDTVGNPETLAVALAAARKGGTIVVTGLSRLDATASLPMFSFVMQEKRLVGSVYGSGRPAEDIVRLVEWYRAGRLKLRELVHRTYPLTAVNEALQALRAGHPGRSLVVPRAAA